MHARSADGHGGRMVRQSGCTKRRDRVSVDDRASLARRRRAGALDHFGRVRQNTQALWLARLLALLVVAGLVLLVFCLPLVAAILFVALTILLAIVRAKAHGFWSGIRSFLKEILFGW